MFMKNVNGPTLLYQSSTYSWMCQIQLNA